MVLVIRFVWCWLQKNVVICSQFNHLYSQVEASDVTNASPAARSFALCATSARRFEMLCDATGTLLEFHSNSKLRQLAVSSALSLSFQTFFILKRSIGLSEVTPLWRLGYMDAWPLLHRNDCTLMRNMGQHTAFPSGESTCCNYVSPAVHGYSCFLAEST